MKEPLLLVMFFGISVVLVQLGFRSDLAHYVLQEKDYIISPGTSQVVSASLVTKTYISRGNVRATIWARKWEL
jgi:hypothetical protein